MKLLGNSLLLLALTFSFTSCSESNDLPVCIDERLSIFQSENANCNGAKVERYEYQEIEVYTFVDGNCITDGGTAVVDEGCSDICFLGGIASLTECNGEDFSDAVLIETIWESN